jgi:hypothetical protein
VPLLAVISPIVRMVRLTFLAILSQESTAEPSKPPSPQKGRRRTLSGGQSPALRVRSAAPCGTSSACGCLLATAQPYLASLCAAQSPSFITNMEVPTLIGSASLQPVQNMFSPAPCTSVRVVASLCACGSLGALPAASVAHSTGSGGERLPLLPDL